MMFGRTPGMTRQTLQEDNPNVLRPVATNTVNAWHNNAVFPPAWPQRVMTPLPRAAHSDVRYDGTLRKWGNR